MLISFFQNGLPSAKRCKILLFGLRDEKINYNLENPHKSKYVNKSVYLTLKERDYWDPFFHLYKAYQTFEIKIYEIYECKYWHSTIKNTAKRNMSSAVCASSMYSRLCMKMSSFLFVHTWAMPRTSCLSCGILFPV